MSLTECGVSTDAKICTMREAAAKAVEYAKEKLAPIHAAHKLELAKKDETIHVLRELLKEKARDIVLGTTEEIT